MKIKQNLGIISITVILLITFFIWFFLRLNTEPFKNFQTTLYSLAQIFSLLATTMFAINFVMITRIKLIQDSFGGLDKMYKIHQLNGKSAFLFILFHPILLILTSYPNIIQTTKLMFSFSHWPLNFGIIALTLLTILIVLTIYSKMKYSNWKISHKFMGVVFIIALFHIFRIGSDIGKYPLLKYYMVFIAIIGITAFVYGVLLGRFLKKRHFYYIESISNKNNISIIKLRPKDKKLIYSPGQFIFIKVIDKQVTKEQHPFTISSSPLEDCLELSIKNLGDYTSKIPNISINSEVQLEEPYGIFGEFNDNVKQVWVSGGIGVTPFLSMIKTLALSKKEFKSIDFYYCVKNESEAIFLDLLNKLTKDLKNFKIITWYSEMQGAISINSIESNISFKDSEFRICGPVPMMKSLSNQLRKKGTKKSKIFFEDFNLK